MQPGWAAAFGIANELGEITFHGTYIEIFNAESRFGTIYRRSIFYSNKLPNGILEKNALEGDICIQNLFPHTA